MRQAGNGYQSIRNACLFLQHLNIGHKHLNIGHIPGERNLLR